MCAGRLVRAVLLLWVLLGCWVALTPQQLGGSTAYLSTRGVSTGYTGAVRLDLRALARRADSAAKVTGIPADQVDVNLVPQVRTTQSVTFSPELRLVLSPLQLALADPMTSLVVKDTTATTASARPKGALGILGHRLSVSLARMLSLLLLLGALVGGGLFVLAGRFFGTQGSEGARIQRRYAPILVQVQPVVAPAGRPVVDVNDSRPSPSWPSATGCWSCTGLAATSRRSSSKTRARPIGTAPA